MRCSGRSSVASIAWRVSIPPPIWAGGVMPSTCWCSTPGWRCSPMRLERSDRATGGTGLGLAIVKGFAEAMGLSVTAADRPAGAADHQARRRGPPDAQGIWRPGRTGAFSRSRDHPSPPAAHRLAARPRRPCRVSAPRHPQHAPEARTGSRRSPADRQRQGSGLSAAGRGDAGYRIASPAAIMTRAARRTLH